MYTDKCVYIVYIYIYNMYKRYPQAIPFTIQMVAIQSTMFTITPKIIACKPWMSNK